jgi:hypothetical protein
VNEGRYPEPELGTEYCEQEPEIPNTEPELPKDFEDGNQSHPLMHALGPSFINITLYPFYKLHIVLLQKHGRIATLDCYG